MKWFWRQTIQCPFSEKELRKMMGITKRVESIEAIPAPRHHVIEILSVRIHVMNWPLLTLYFRWINDLSSETPLLRENRNTAEVSAAWGLWTELISATDSSLNVQEAITKGDPYPFWCDFCHLHATCKLFWRSVYCAVQFSSRLIFDGSLNTSA